METHEKIRTMRELNQFTQEEMAEKLAITAGGYAKIERGESSINLTRLEQIAQILNINVAELLKNDTGLVIQLGGDNNHQTSIYTTTSSDLISEIEKLKLIIQHKDEIIDQKDRELAAKDEIIALLKNKVC